MEQNKTYLKYGGPEHKPVDFQLLKAGPLECQYEAGNLRYISAGGIELIRMIYPAVRDENWGTVLPELVEEKVDAGKDHFKVHYRCRYQSGEIYFEADYRINGSADGVLVFEMEGEVLNAFKKNRIGFNVLHPPELAGVACEIEHTSGDVETGLFPEKISPHQPFMDIKAINWQLGEAKASLNFEGDIFEMEDQRNWTDASFKTYSTPLSLPFPVALAQGEKISQKVSLFLHEKSTAQENTDDEEILVKLTDESFPLPEIGLCQSSEVEIIDREDVDWLCALPWSHYRVDLRLDDENLSAKWQRACEESQKLELPLELALHFGRDLARELGFLLDLLDRHPARVKQVLLFSREDKTTPEALKKNALADLRSMFPHARIGGGTDCFFTELNRERVSPDKLDFLTYSLNPQVHHSDHQSLIETLAAQAFTVDSARHFCGSVPIHLSPITLKMRFNPNATSEEPPVPEGELPPQVDPRQQSLFAAAWTMGSIKYLTESRASSITYFETMGRRGILPGKQAQKHLTISEKPFYPMYWVFYFLLRKFSKFRKAISNDPLKLEALAGETQEGAQMIMLANFHDHTQQLEVEGVDEEWQQYCLDEESFYELPEKVENWKSMAGEKVKLPLTMKPFSICVLAR